jgi:hypothetical protein
VQNGFVVNLVLWDGQSDITWPEGTLVIETDGSVHIGFGYDGSKFINQNPTGSQTLEDAQDAQVSANNVACAAAITAGFQSTALGAWYTYPSKVTDQQNLNASVVASLLPGIPATWVTPFWCQDSNGTWAYVYHTATQIQKVGQDAKGAILTLLNKNAQLQASVMAATTAQAVQSINW